MRPAPVRPDRPLAIFDVARTLAALAVVAAHARTFVFLDAPDQPHLGWLGRVFFGLTGFGHQAVILFFVVSGALVTRSMLAMHGEDRWSAGGFAAARLTRLWMVLVPCLLLGGLQDRLGLALSVGRYGAPGISAASVADNLGGGAFAANLFFLQGPLFPTFGSNAPLWTLSMEAWCYGLGFALMSFWRRPDRSSALAAAVVAGIAALLLGRTFCLLFPIWLLGAALALALSIAPDGVGGASGASAALTRGDGGAAIALLALMLVGTRLMPPQYEMAGAYGLACATVGVLWCFSDFAPRPGVGRVGRLAAGFSYSLYLSHFPLLALSSIVVLQQRRLAFGLHGFAVWLVFAVLAFAQAVLLWWLFERHTARVRTIVARWFLAHRRRVTPLGEGGSQ